MAKIISIVNHKGGVGKTTSVANVGKAISMLGRKVLLIDTDAQANLTSFFMDVNEERPTICDAIVGKKKLQDTIINIGENFDLVPSSILLAGVESQISNQLAREWILAKLLKPVQDKYDIVIIDCPPALSIITSNDLVASDFVFIPLVGETLPMIGLSMLQNIIDGVKEINNKLEIGGIFLTRFNNRKLNSTVHGGVAAAYPDKIMKIKIRECISIAEAPATLQTIFEYAPDSNGSQDYMDLAKELIGRCGI